MHRDEEDSLLKRQMKKCSEEERGNASFFPWICLLSVHILVENEGISSSGVLDAYSLLKQIKFMISEVNYRKWTCGGPIISIYADRDPRMLNSL